MNLVIAPVEEGCECIARKKRITVSGAGLNKFCASLVMQPRLIDSSVYTNKAYARAETCFGNVGKGMRFCPPEAPQPITPSTSSCRLVPSPMGILEWDFRVAGKSISQSLSSASRISGPKVDFERENCAELGGILIRESLDGAQYFIGDGWVRCRISELLPCIH